MSDVIKINYTLPSVEFSNKQLQELVSEQLAEIKNDASLTADKARVATRKLIKEYDEQRKDITRRWDQYKKDFAGAVNAALAEATEYEQQLTDIINEQEEQRKKEKLQQIANMEGYEHFIEYWEVPNEWLLKGTTMESIQKEMDDLKTYIDQQIKAITTTATAAGLEAERYTAMIKSSRYEDIMNRIIEDQQLLKEKQTDPEPVRASPEEQTLTVIREITGTSSQLNALKKYADKIGVTIKKI